MTKLIFTAIVGVILTSSTSLGDDAEKRTEAEPVVVDHVPTFAFARAIGASAAVFVAPDRMTTIRETREQGTWAFTAALLARFDLPFGAR